MREYLTGHMKRLFDFDKTRTFRIVVHDASADPPEPRYVYSGKLDSGEQLKIMLPEPVPTYADYERNLPCMIHSKHITIMMSFINTSSGKSYNMPLAYISPDDLAKLDQRSEDALPSCLQRIR